MQTEIGMLPSMEVGETIYSWASRSHILLGHSADWFSRHMFGSIRAARTPDAPMNLAHLFEITSGRLGHPREILSKRTSLGGFFPYLNETRRQAVTDALLTGRGARGSLCLGIRASGLPGTFHLRFCSDCIEADITSIGLACWKVIHQLPAVWICPLHQTVLVELQKCTTVWQLPRLDQRVSATPVPDEIEGALKLAATISIAAFELGDINLKSLRQAALERLCSIGLVNNPARLPFQSLHAAFCSSNIGLAIRNYQPLKPLLENRSWFCDLLRDRVAQHPIKWALAWVWMWQDADTVIAEQSFRMAANGDFSIANVVQAEMPFDEPNRMHRICVERIIDAMPFVSSMGELAAHIRASSSDVNRWFRSYPVLKTKWSNRVREIRLSNAVHRVELHLLHAKPTSDIELLNACRADLVWLTRHEAQTAYTLRSTVPMDRPRQLVLFKRNRVTL